MVTPVYLTRSRILQLIRVPLELGMDSLPTFLPAVLKADVSARKDNEKKNPFERNETGFFYGPKVNWYPI
jgi:hypothetical protein